MVSFRVAGATSAVLTFLRRLGFGSYYTHSFHQPGKYMSICYLVLCSEPLVPPQVGEELAVVIYTIVAIWCVQPRLTCIQHSRNSCHTTSLQLVVWFVPSLIGNALAVSFIGFCFGPLYPIAVSYASYLIPQHMLAPTLALVCGLGTTGQAIIPFATGAMASRFGIQSMQPL